MLPLAPARLSVITPTFQRSASFGPRMRASMSAPVPGVYGTTSVTLRDGKDAESCARRPAVGTAISTVRQPAKKTLEGYLWLTAYPPAAILPGKKNSGRAPWPGDNKCIDFRLLPAENGR